MKVTYSIREVQRVTGLSLRTIRHLERCGLFPVSFKDKDSGNQLWLVQQVADFMRAAELPDT